MFSYIVFVFSYDNFVISSIKSIFFLLKKSIKISSIKSIKVDRSSLWHFILFFGWLGLPCCTGAFSSCHEWGLLSVAVRGLLTAVAPRCGARVLGAGCSGCSTQAQELWLAGSGARAQ